ncbi:hypothetical protein Agub_g13174 [Astrephomene gubernaculifera]|uniref:Protein kinase domain-containing protein n=1 Tax=Astrephomene gubernaculifera TaxID=47775 RepID=A0AAD3HR92_9CHLO|nr:hypothetical protein Agub_g13174 [Astrephomene gubernaculifera]
MEILARRPGGLPAPLETLKIGRTLGKGGFAVVKNGTLKTDDGTLLQVAVKILHPEYSDEYRQELRLFKEEAELVLQLDHRNIITAYGLLKLPPKFPGLDGNYTKPAHALVLELMAGGSLAGLMIKQLVAGTTPKYTFSQALGWSLDVARALQYLHTGGRDGFPRLHRDVKLENVLLTAGMCTAKLADFGLQRAVASQQEQPTMMVRRSQRPSAPAARSVPTGPSRLAPDATKRPAHPQQQPATTLRPSGQASGPGNPGPPCGTQPTDNNTPSARHTARTNPADAQHTGPLFFTVSNKGLTPLVHLNSPCAPRDPSAAAAAAAASLATQGPGSSSPGDDSAAALERLRGGLDLDLDVTRRSASMSQLEWQQPGSKQAPHQHPLAATAPGGQVSAGPVCKPQPSSCKALLAPSRPNSSGGRTSATQLRGRVVAGGGMAATRPSPLGPSVARVRQDSVSDAAPRLSSASLTRLGGGGGGSSSVGGGAAVPAVSVTDRGPLAGGGAAAALVRGSSFGVSISPRGRASGDEAATAALAARDGISKAPVLLMDSLPGDAQLSATAAATATDTTCSCPVSSPMDGRPSATSARDVMLGEMLLQPQEGRMPSPTATTSSLAARPASARRPAGQVASGPAGGGAVSCISDQPLRLVLPDVVSADQGYMRAEDCGVGGLILPGSAKHVDSRSTTAEQEGEEEMDVDPVVEAMRSVAAWREASMASVGAADPGEAPGSRPAEAEAKRQVSMPNSCSGGAGAGAKDVPPQFNRNSCFADIAGGDGGGGAEGRGSSVLEAAAPMQLAELLQMRIGATNVSVRSVRNSGSGVAGSRPSTSQRMAAIAAAVRASAAGAEDAAGAAARERPSGMRSAGVKKVPAAEFEEVFSLTGRTGSLIYLAPEAYKNEPYNDKVDVYSLAVLMYELFGRTSLTHTHISTKLPAFSRMIHDANEFAERVAAGYRPPRPRQMDKLPLALWELIEAGWHQDPVQRPDMDAVVETLEELVEPLAAADAHSGAACGCVIS